VDVEYEVSATFVSKMVLFSMFSNSSSAIITERVESMKVAEHKLMKFAHRYVVTPETETTSSTTSFRTSNDIATDSCSFETDDGNAVVDISLVNTRISKARVFGVNRSSSIMCQVVQSETNNDDDADALTIHGVKVTCTCNRNNNKKEKMPLLLLHGYGNAALYFYRTLTGLSIQHYGTVYALDMLGWGISSRPHFVTNDNHVREAEKFFVESVEAWREANKIDQFVLGAHSMGGYLAVAYAECYPNRVKRLILISPAGVPHKDEEVENTKWYSQPLLQRLVVGFGRKIIWNLGITPFQIFRFWHYLLGSRAMSFVQSYLDEAFAMIDCKEEKAALSDYLLLNTMLPGSGEHVLSRVLQEGMFAIEPLVDRIPKLQVGFVSFLYGELDWMDKSGGLEVKKMCKIKEGNGENAPIVDVYDIKGAGHSPMLENWVEFNSAMILSGGGQLHSKAMRPKLL